MVLSSGGPYIDPMTNATPTLTDLSMCDTNEFLKNISNKQDMENNLVIGFWVANFEATLKESNRHHNQTLINNMKVFYQQIFLNVEAEKRLANI